MDVQRLALFQELLKKKGIRLAPAGITRRQSSEGKSAEACLSFAQQRLWFIDQLEQGRAHYHKPCGLILRGPLDREALSRSIQRIIQRHEILRTVFVVRNEQPMQVVHEHLAVSVRQVDLRQLPFPQRQTEVQQLAHREIQQPFDLTRGPLLRSVVFQVAEQEHVLLLTFHHIIFDDWSLGIVMRELAALYPAYRAGTSSPLADLALHYADFAVWQRSWLQGEVLHQQMQYWKEHLYNAPPVLDMPTDYPRPPLQNYQGAYLPITVPPHLHAKLQLLCRQSETTLFVVLLAAFQTLLYRYSGQEDIVVGTPIANRNRVETENMIGFFINTLALRTNLSGNPDFLEFVQRVRAVTLGAYSHQDIPFEKLVEELQPERALNRPPLFQVLFTLHNVPLSPPDIPGLTMTPFEVKGEAVHFDITLAFEETAQGLQGTLGYRTCLFAPATLEYFVRHFHMLLENICTNPQQRLAAFPLFAQTEQQLFAGAFHPGHLHPPMMCVHTLFEEQAARFPDACALVYDDHAIAYQELQRRSNQVADVLRSSGVTQETLVGIYVHRSLEMIIGLLGVLRAGGAYIPLDPSFPGERLASLLDALRVRYVLTTTGLSERVAQRSSLHTLCLDDWSTFEMFPAQVVRTPVHPVQLAYVISTSGSTGQPKAVGVEHRQIVQYIHGVAEALHLATSQHFALVSTFAADLGNTVLFPALCYGKCLHILSQETLSDPDLFRIYCAEHAIEVVKITPSHLLLLLNASNPADVMPRRQLILGGEACQWSWVEQLLELAPRALALTNHYGPTETTVGATIYPIERRVSQQFVPRVPIGRPLPHAQAFVLNAAWQRAPVGGVGELYIGGAGITRGYLNQPDTTAEKFIPHPWSQDRGARLYRTGDKVRLHADGVIEFIGRIDDQVKLRGFRIEPGEIETVLCHYPAIREAVVIVQGEATDEKRLVAYLVAHDGQALVVSAIRRYLQERLPEYMVPSTFVHAASLPRNPHGKRDRQALQGEPIREVEEHMLRAPRDQLELRMQQIWEEVLTIHPVGITQNFFDAGGNSFSAVRLMQRIQRIFACSVPLATLFHYPTIEQLSAYIRQSQSERPEPSCLVRLDSGPTTGRPFFFLHPIGGNVFCYQKLAHMLADLGPVYALQAQGLTGRRAPARSITQMATQYLQLIQHIQPAGSYRLAGWSFGGIVAFEIAQQLQAQRQEIAFLGIIDSTAPEDNLPETREFAASFEAFAVDLGVRTVQQDENLSLPIEDGRVDDALLERLLTRARQVQVVPADVELPYIRQLWQVYQTNQQALLGYQPHMYAGALNLFQAVPSLEECAPHVGGAGWQRWVQQKVALHPVVGDHYSLLEMPGVERIAEIVRRTISGEKRSAKD